MQGSLAPQLKELEARLQKDVATQAKELETRVAAVQKGLKGEWPLAHFNLRSTSWLCETLEASNRPAA